MNIQLDVLIRAQQALQIALQAADTNNERNEVYMPIFRACTELDAYIRTMTNQIKVEVEA